MALLSRQELRFCRKPKSEAQRSAARQAWGDFVRQSDEVLFREFDEWSLKESPANLLLPIVEALTWSLRRLPAVLPQSRGDRLLGERLANLIAAARRIVKEPPSTADSEGMVEPFRRLSAQWHSETRFLSSITDIVIHPAYQRIIGMGSPAITLILAELQESPDHWFWALGMITGTTLELPPELQGNTKALANAWLQWGRENAYID